MVSLAAIKFMDTRETILSKGALETIKSTVVQTLTPPYSPATGPATPSVKTARAGPLAPRLKG